MSAANGGNGNGGNGGGGVGGGFLLLAPPSYRSTKTLCFCSVVTVVVVFSVTVIVPFWVSVLSGDWVDTTNWDGSMGRTCPSSPAVSAAAAGAAAQLDSASMPFWSRGFARSCCTSYPKRFVKHYKGYFEAGDLTDPLYFLKYRRHIRDGDILYVAVADVPRFTRVFSELPQDVRITLVTGQEDIGAPYEIFHPNRPGHKHYRMSELWAWPNTQRMTMREFLADKRLHRYVRPPPGAAPRTSVLMRTSHCTCARVRAAGGTCKITTWSGATPSRARTLTRSSTRTSWGRYRGEASMYTPRSHSPTLPPFSRLFLSENRSCRSPLAWISTATGKKTSW